MNRRRARTRGRRLAFALGLFVSAGVRAQTVCPAPREGAPALAELDGRVRLEWIHERLWRESGRASFWNWAWAIGIGASGVATLVPVPFVAPNDRVDYYTGAGTAAVGLIPFLVAPPDVIDDGAELHARMVGAPPLTDAGVCVLLADAEQRMVRDARNEQLLASGWSHLANVVVNGGVILFLGLGFHHWSAGLANGLSGIAVGEAIILTTPGHTIDELGRYERGDLGP